MMRAHTRTRAGFSLVELVVAITILSVIGVALSKMIIGQSRTFQIDNGARRARMTGRSAMNILTSDFRMVQDYGAIDSIDTANNRWIDVRVPVAFGIVCEANAGNVVLSVVAVDSFQVASSKYAGYAVRNSSTGLYGYSNAGASDTIKVTDASRCHGGIGAPSIAADTWPTAGRRGKVYLASPAPPAGATVGAPAFVYQSVRYQFDTSTVYSKRYGLFRKIRGRGNTDTLTEELIAPFEGSARFRYYTNPWTTKDTVTTTAPANLNTIRGLQIYLPAQASDTVPGATKPRKATTTFSVFFKNVRSQ
jgi:prepilin-type N-terminal cleavage/methylation domain-containing protein